MTGPRNPNVVDLVTQAVVAQFQQQIAPKIDAAVHDAQVDAQRQLYEFMQQLPHMPLQEHLDTKADARVRAGRTAVQGALATVVVAGILGVAGVIGSGNFDFTSSGDWKAVAGAGIGAIVAAGAAYVQRLVNPPRQGGQNTEQ